LLNNRQQIFAEAVERFRDGEDWWQVPEVAAERQRDARRDIDPWEESIRNYVDAKDSVQINTILASVISLDLEDVDMRDQRRVAKILRQIGWVNAVTWNGEKTLRRWVPKSKRSS
jgi:predicted P-loop ATPase